MGNDAAPFKLIKAGRLIDGLGGPPRERMAVLIEGSRIRAVGPEESVVPPEGAAVVEYSYPDQTVLPGLVDAHTHINGFGDGRSGDELAQMPDDILLLQSARNARVALQSGVTTIRENGPKGRTALSLKEGIRMGIVPGPRMVVCGRPMAITGGHMGYFGSEADGVDAVRKMVRQLIKEGSDYIKITATGGTTRTSFPLLPSYNVDELKAIVEEAHKFGKLTAAHCVSTQGIINCLDAGVDMIIHCSFREPDGTYKFREDVAERIGKQGAWVNPTLHVLRASVWRLQEKARQGPLTPAERARLDQVLLGHAKTMEFCGRMISMGLKVIAGSDSSWGDYQLGGFVHEVHILAEAGMSNTKAILAGTRDSAASIGVGNIVGTLEPGKEADVLVVNGDPSASINALWNVVALFQEGTPAVVR